MFEHFIINADEIINWNSDHIRISYKDNNPDNLTADNLLWKSKEEQLSERKKYVWDTIMPFCIKNKRFPNTDELRKNFSKAYNVLRLYLGGATQVAIDMGYPYVEHWTKENIILAIIENNNKMFTPDQRKNMHGFDNAVVKLHGGIIKLCEKLNIIPSGWYKTIDGSLVKSVYEAKISNFLFINNIIYSYNERIFENTEHRADFILRNGNGELVNVEMWGYDRNIIYNEKRKLKEGLYINKILISLNCIDFEKKSLSHINNILKQKMIEFNIKLENFSENIDSLDQYENHYYTDWLESIKKYCVDNDLKYLPMKKDLKLAGFETFINYINRYKISTQSVADYVGIPLIQKPTNFYDNEINIEKELLKIINDNDIEYFPVNTEELKNSFSYVVQRKGTVYWSRKIGYKFKFFKRYYKEDPRYIKYSYDI
jgi:hypothetical protein